jgi:hypothetical protein
MADALAIADDRTRRRGRDWGLSPTIERARASREPNKPQQPVAAIKPAPIEVVRVELVPIEVTGRVLAEFVDYDGLWGSLRARVNEMGITREELDRLTGLADRYCSKILGPSQVRKLGKHSLGPMLGAVCCKLVLVEDPVATAKMMARAKKRKIPLQQLKLLSPRSPRQ